MTLEQANNEHVEMGDFRRRHSGERACDCNERLNRVCFYHKLKTIQFGGRGRSPQSLMESRWERDMPAYKRLRNNGLQPKQIDGCAEIEKRANSQLEVEMGHMIPKEILPQVTEGMAMSRELAWKPQDSVESVKDKYHRQT